MRPVVRKAWKLSAHLGGILPFLCTYRRPSAVVLMYHGVKRGGGDHINIGLDRFREDMRWLDERFEFVDLPEVVDAVDRQGTQIAVTFDDAFRNVHENALPVLEELGVPATVFVNPGRLGPQEEDRYPNMSADEIRGLVESRLFTVGNHTRDHVDLTACSSEEKREQIVGGKEDLEDRFGISVDRFAYPWGRYDEEAVDIVREGHECAVTTEHRHVSDVDDACLLPRLSPSDSLQAFQWDMSDVGRRILPWVSGI